MNANKQLKKLSIEGKDLFYDDLLSKTTCKLTDIIISLDPSPKVRQNLILFLKMQSESLKYLKIKTWMGKEVMDTILSMPHLIELSLGLRLWHYSAVPENLGQSQSIVRLEIFQGDRIEFAWYESLLKAFPKVESLVIFELDNSLADLISENCKSLKRLSSFHFNATDVSNEAFYLNLEELSCQIKKQNSSQQLFEKLNGKSYFNDLQELLQNIE